MEIGDIKIDYINKTAYMSPVIGGSELFSGEDFAPFEALKEQIMSACTKSPERLQAEAEARAADIDKQMAELQAEKDSLGVVTPIKEVI